METDSRISPIVFREINRLVRQGWTQASADQFDEAEESFREAFAITYADGGRIPYNTAYYLNCLSSLYEKRDKLETAEELHLAAIAADRDEGNETQTRVRMHILALFHIRHRHFDRAEAILVEHLDQPAWLLEYSQAEKVNNEMALACLREAQECYDETEQIYLHAIQRLESSSAAEYLSLPLLAYAAYLPRQGREGETAALYEREQIARDTINRTQRAAAGDSFPAVS